MPVNIMPVIPQPAILFAKGAGPPLEPAHHYIPCGIHPGYTLAVRAFSLMSLGIAIGQFNVSCPGRHEYIWRNWGQVVTFHCSSYAV